GFMQDGIENGAGGIAPEGKNAGGHLVTDDAEREEIRAGIQLLAQNLFRGHIGDSSQCRAGTREMFRGSAERGRNVGQSGGNTRGSNLREAKIENLRVTTLGDEDVGGFYVAMDDAFPVSGVEGVRDLDGHL